MARPRRPVGEAQLVKAALVEIGATGSGRARAAQLAERAVAHAMAVQQSDEFGGRLAQLAVIAETPSLAALAFDPDGVVAAELHRAAMAEFERRGCRHAPPAEWPTIDQALRAAAAARLAERFRRPPK